MKVVGYDPSSSIGGLAVVKNGLPTHIDIWKPNNPKQPASERLYQWYIHAKSYLDWHHPDMVVVEIIALAKSHQVTRILSRYESAMIVAAKEKGIIVIEHRVSEARKQVFDNGSMKKQDAYKELVKRYPDLPWLGPKDKEGGCDQSDALTGALAGPALAER